MVLDLDQVEFMDSSGVAVLSDAYVLRREKGEVFQIVSASRPVRRVLDICGLLDLLTEGAQAV